mgnify:CR=1 FL=1
MLLRLLMYCNMHPLRVGLALVLDSVIAPEVKAEAHPRARAAITPEVLQLLEVAPGPGVNRPPVPFPHWYSPSHYIHYVKPLLAMGATISGEASGCWRRIPTSRG